MEEMLNVVPSANESFDDRKEEKLNPSLNALAASKMCNLFCNNSLGTNFTQLAAGSFFFRTLESFMAENDPDGLEYLKTGRYGI